MVRKGLLLVLVLLLPCTNLACDGPTPEQVQAGLLKVIANWNTDVVTGETTDSYDEVSAYIAYRWAVREHLEDCARFVLKQTTAEIVKAAVDFLFPGSSLMTQALRGLVVKWLYKDAVEFLSEQAEFRSDSVTLAVSEVNELLQTRMILPAIAEPIYDLPGDLIFTEYFLVGYDREARRVSVLVISDCGGKDTPLGGSEPRAWEAEYEIDEDGLPKNPGQSLQRVDLASIQLPPEEVVPPEEEEDLTKAPSALEIVNECKLAFAKVVSWRQRISVNPPQEWERMEWEIMANEKKSHVIAVMTDGRRREGYIWSGHYRCDRWNEGSWETTAPLAKGSGKSEQELLFEQIFGGAENLALIGAETVQGKACYILEHTRPAGEYGDAHFPSTKIKVWIDVNSYLPLKETIEFEETTSTIEYYDYNASITIEMPVAAPTPETRQFAWDVDMTELEHIVISLPQQGRSEAFIKHTDTLWYFDEPGRPRANPNRFGPQIPLLLSSAPGVERLIAKDATEEKLAVYGFTQPQMEIVLTLENGDIINIEVGDSTPGGKDCYVKLVDSNDVYTVDHTWYEVLERLVTEPPYPTPEEE